MCEVSHVGSQITVQYGPCLFACVLSLRFNIMLSIACSPIYSHITSLSYLLIHLCESYIIMFVHLCACIANLLFHLLLFVFGISLFCFLHGLLAGGGALWACCPRLPRSSRGCGLCFGSLHVQNAQHL